MTTTLTGTEPGLSAYYSFDEGQGLTAHDATPNHDDGTLTGTNGDLPTWSDSSGLGIGLGSDGISSNSTKVRRGPNELQNDPVVVATTLAGRLTGWLGGSLPNSLYHLEFFAAAGYAPAARGRPRPTSGRSRLVPTARARLCSTSRSARRRTSPWSPRPQPTSRAIRPKSRPCEKRVFKRRADRSPGSRSAAHPVGRGR